MIKDPLYTQVKVFLPGYRSYRPVRCVEGRAETNCGESPVRTRDDAWKDPSPAGLRIPVEQSGSCGVWVLGGKWIAVSTW